ncbi:CopJ/RHH family DNA binding protein [Natrarchaeobaculum sulfurireducens]|uniref:CopJ/RHH family DNA binding protein n=1 Tax=Natrarchaeobaculum sulfurireducens TaxID=2044521 RepID=A0A346PQM6_9EURY|nr:CopJ/RHH family DNA binding protein [Natrarchaeobaculum sulfurireducens]
MSHKCNGSVTDMCALHKDRDRQRGTVRTTERDKGLARNDVERNLASWCEGVGFRRAVARGLTDGVTRFLPRLKSWVSALWYL